MTEYLDIIFGDVLGKELAGLNITKLGLNLNEIVGEAENEKEEKTELVSEMTKEKEDDEIDLPLNDDELNLDVLGIELGEKMFQFSDLYIPLNKKLKNKIIKYNQRIIDDIEKVDQDIKKEQDEEDLKNIIYKSKKNQQYVNVNFTYNEKFFDKTFFSEDTSKALNFKNDNIFTFNSLGPNGNYQLLSNENELYNENSKYDFKTWKMNLTNSQENENIQYKMINSLYESKKFIETNEKILFEEKNKSNQSVEKNNNTNKNKFKSGLKLSENSEKEIIKLLLNKNENEDENDFEEEDDIYEYSEEENSKSKENSIEKPERKKKIGFNLSISSYGSKTVLYDYIKRKRFSYPLPLNNEIKKGNYINAIVSDNINDNDYYIKYNNLLKYSKTINDLSDYNMNYELINESSNEKNRSHNKSLSNRKKSDEIIAFINSSTNDDTNFSSFIKKLALSSYTSDPSQQTLKIGKVSKSNIITHTKCAYNLGYSKLNLSIDELKNFHRSDFSKYLYNKKKKSKSSFKINNYIQNNDYFEKREFKSYPIIIRTRSYLKLKEKKRIQKNVQYMNAYEIFKNYHKLSINEGKYSLFEHIDEDPLFINNFGMATKLKKYLFNNKLFNNSIQNSKLTENEMKTINTVGPFGIQILLNEDQKVPLLGQLDNTGLKGISLIENKMYKSPVFYEKNDIVEYIDKRNEINHIYNNKEKETKKEGNEEKERKRNKVKIQIPINNPVENSTSMEKKVKRMRFLITFKKKNEKETKEDSASSSERFYLRELEHYYVIGQEEPKIEVYAPQSKQYNNFLKNKIQTYIEKIYDEVGYKSGINFRFFSSLFPNVTEQILKKHLKEIGVDVDKNICFYSSHKLPNQKHESLISPENICQYESCLRGIFKLRQLGIKNLTNSDKISYACNKYIQSLKDPQKQFLAKVVEEELLTTPWNLTMNYLQSKQINGMLSIKGIGDPSNGNGGYSYIKMPVKQYNSDNKTLKEEIDMLKEQNKNIKTVTGTEADLRKLSKQEIKMKLIQLGIDEEYINKLSRWERVSVLRYKSSKAVELGYEGDITKYARGNRIGTSAQRETYQQNINEVFKKFIDYLFTQQSSLLEINNLDEDDLVKLKQAANQAVVENIEEIYEDSNVLNDKTLSFAKADLLNPDGTVKLFKKSKKKQENKQSKQDQILKLYSNSNLDENNNNFKIGLKNDDIELLRHKRKFNQGFNKVYEYDFDSKTPILFNRKRRNAPEKKFNEIIEDIIDNSIALDKSRIFHTAVKKKDYPDYYDKISTPMDLGTMKNKTKRNEYTSVEQFIQDLDQMGINSELYNGSKEISSVTSQAFLIIDNAKKMLELRNKDLEDALIINK